MSNILTKVGLSVVTALAGGAAWMVAEPSAQNIFSMFKGGEAKVELASASATEAVVAAPAAAPDRSLADAMSGLAELARAARRPDTEVVALTAAGVRLTELNNKIAALGPADGVARELLMSDVNETALTAARTQITALANDGNKAATAILNDLKTAESDQASIGKQLDPDSARASASATEAQATVQAAVAASAGTNPTEVLAAVSRAQQAVVTLTSLRSTASTAYMKGKRASFDANISISRSIALEIGALAKRHKASILSSKEKKADSKFIQDTDVWARERVGGLEVLVPVVPTADRRTLSQHASLAASTRSELEAALENTKIAAAKLAK